jgi:fructose-specific component phosphotransferase system IIB-like protein
MSSSEPVPAALAGFTRLGHSSYIYDPPSSSGGAEKASNTPDVILLAAFMNAQPKHAAKYTNGYRLLYPQTRIIVIFTSLAVVVWKTAGYKREHRRPVLEVLLALPPGTRMLLHSFSNGGAYTTSLLAQDYLARTGQPLPVAAAAFDSSPGRIRKDRTFAAFTTAFPKTIIIYQLLQGLLLIYLLCLGAAQAISGRSDRITRLFDELNDTRLFRKGAPRVYLYSREDAMIHWEDVLEHAVAAAALGWKCETVEFKGTGHCNHIALDSKPYFDALQRVWQQAERS